MTESGTPVRRQTTRLLAGGKKHGYATLLLYPDKLAAVSSGAVRIGMSAGAIVVFSLTLLIPPHTGPGALGALIGVGAGYLIGAPSPKARPLRKRQPVRTASRLYRSIQSPASRPGSPRLARRPAPYRDDSGRGRVRVRREAGQMVG